MTSGLHTGLWLAACLDILPLQDTAAQSHQEHSHWGTAGTYGEQDQGGLRGVPHPTRIPKHQGSGAVSTCPHPCPTSCTAPAALPFTDTHRWGCLFPDSFSVTQGIRDRTISMATSCTPHPSAFPPSTWNAMAESGHPPRSNLSVAASYLRGPVQAI